MGSDAGGDPGAMGDGILGTNPTTLAILYQPDKVATGAYALLDLAANNPGDADASKWITAARQALDHIHAKARDPKTGLYFASMTTTGSSADTVSDLTFPRDLLSSDVQATILLYLYRSELLVSADTMLADGGFQNPGVPIPLDAALTGELSPMSDFPFFDRADALIIALDALWDGCALFGDTREAGAPCETREMQGKHGYFDGLVASTGKVVTTKSTRPNAYMFGSLNLQARLEGNTKRSALVPLLRVLLVDETPPTGIMLPGPTFITAVSMQQAYFDTVTEGFGLLAQSVSPTAQSYTASAVAAVFAGFDEQLVGFNF
jgi:hypothetical protein